MSKKYENKSIHNRNFLSAINNDYPNEYFDWKVTVQFYSALHRCYCVLEARGEEIETSHSRNIKNIKSIDVNMSMGLFKLYKHSRQSRYEGFMSEEAMERINKINFAEGLKILHVIEKNCLKYYPVAAS